MDLFFLKVNVIGLAIIVRLNGVPIINEQSGSGYTETLPVNIWLKPAGNVLEVTLRPPEGSTVDRKESSVDVVLFMHDPATESPTIRKRLAELKFSPSNLPPNFPHTWSSQISERLMSLPPASLWTQTTEISALTDSDKKAMFETVRSLSLYLFKKDLDNAYKILSFRYQDESALEGKPVAKIEKAVKELWSEMLHIKTIRLTPVSFGDCAFTLVGQNKLVHVTRARNAPVIEFSDQENDIQYGIDLYFGLIKGQWVVLR